MTLTFLVLSVIIVQLANAQTFNPVDHSYSYEGKLTDETKRQFLLEADKRFESLFPGIEREIDTAQGYVLIKPFLDVRTAQGGSLAKKKGKLNYVVIVKANDVSFEVKVSNFVHMAEKKRDSGGSLSNDLPDCGKLYLSEDAWRKLKDQAKDKALTVIKKVKNISE